MAQVTVKPHLSYFTGLTLPERDALYNFFSVKDPSLNFMPRMRQLIARKIIDGCVHLFNQREGVLATGLLKKALGVVPNISIIDNDITICNDTWQAAKKNIRSTQLNQLTPRQDQVEAAVAMINGRRGVVTIATNGGKTIVGALAVKALGLKTLWIVERKELLHQTSEELSSLLGVPVGKIGDGIKKDMPFITVAMAQTIRPNKQEWIDYLAKFNVVIFDEAHHLANGTEQKIGNCLTNAPFRFAMTGSLPKDKLKALKIMGQTDCVNLYNITNKELIDAGHSASPTVILETVEHQGIQDYRVATTDGDTYPEKIPYMEQYERLVSNNARYDGLVSAEAVRWVKEGLSTFVIVDRVQQGQHIASLINEAGVKCEFLSGSDATFYRKDKIKDFKLGVLPCIVATMIFDEGVNVPRIQALILAGAGKSSVKLLQRVGRALRRKEGMAENVAFIIDFLHKGEKYSNRHSAERVRIYHRETFEIREGKTHKL